MNLILPNAKLSKPILSGLFLLVLQMVLLQVCFGKLQKSSPYQVIAISGSDTLHLGASPVIKVNQLNAPVAFYWKTGGSEVAYKVKIDGHSLDWTDLGSDNFVLFTLEPGDYRFSLMDSDNLIFESTFTIVRIRSYDFWITLMASGFLILIATYSLLRYKRVIARLRKEIQSLINLNKRLFDKGAAIAIKREKGVDPAIGQRTLSEKFEKVTVLFADIEGFTKIVEHLNPDLLIDELDKFFIRFDEVVEKYDIEKIKTIGDAYMCAGGIPQKNRTNPIEVVLAAIEMQQFMKREGHPREPSHGGIWELRIGIHTGPVISGMVGRKKIAFDIWGDSVNIASRMESSGKAGEINITGVTYQLIRDFFVCQYRGRMPIKYKGETEMYFVKNIMPELSVNGEGVLPNEQFFIRLQHIRFGDLEEYVLEQLRNGLPKSMTYHDVSHTVDVVTRVEVIGRGEEVSEGDLLLLKTAALLHDVGFLEGYANHEDTSIRICGSLLPSYHYNASQIEIISKLIDVTRLDAVPETLLEMIMKDADLDYLGRSDYIYLSEQLFSELNNNGRTLSLKEWNQMQHQFIENHRYYTATARHLRQVNKVRQLEKLKLLNVV
jgi:class 3 adenylate cyclase